MNAFKCKKCDYGPCYCRTTSKKSSGIYGEEDDGHPLCCPYFGDQEYPEFQPVLPEVCLNTKFCDRMMEWLESEGYDDVPEDLRDAIYGCSLEPRGIIDPGKAFRALQIVRQYDERYLWGDELEKWQKEFAKIKKIDLLNAIFPIAFRAGIIFGEIERQKREAGTK